MKQSREKEVSVLRSALQYRTLTITSNKLKIFQIRDGLYSVELCLQELTAY
jgi:hypothetical protein